MMDNQLAKITAQELAAKYKGKREIYKYIVVILFTLNLCSLLTVDVGYYLPNYKTINVYWMKEIMANRKKAIKNQDVSYLFAP